ncbi:MAG TPA: FAD-dependent oxidoreductase [Terriglobales bacterium]|jgi:geranylgeranyl reductase family protein|nr:FAD-dependent oxidoreductase [Terriglobales bacterium]
MSIQLPIAELPVAIVGGGPAGALAAALLGARGRNVLLFDEKLAWEKPCGGGITHKALQRYPFLAETGSASNLVSDCEIISPSGQRVRFKLQHPVAIFSRLALNGFLLDRAGSAGTGVEIRNERVTRIARIGEGWQLITPQHEYKASYLILAAGARNRFRAQFLAPISPSDLMVTAGYFIPGESSPGDGSLMQIQFLQGITGYIWVFPRANHVSAGIAGKMGETSTGELRRILEKWLAENGFLVDGARFYSHILPSFRAQTFETLEVCGKGWAMIGDNAGLVDPITGEGLYYALRSAELCADALLGGQPDGYRTRMAEEILRELRLAARVSQRFYKGQVFGDSVLERMVGLTAQSATFRELMSDLFAGIQGYGDLRARLYRILPAVMKECLGETLGWPWNNIGGAEFAGDSSAE